MIKSDSGLFPMVAKTLFGLEEILAQELKTLGAQAVKIGVRNVQFVGDTGFMYKANLCLRTALRILKPIHRSNISKIDEVYQAMHGIASVSYTHLTLPTKA